MAVFAPTIGLVHLRVAQKPDKVVHRLFGGTEAVSLATEEVGICARIVGGSLALFGKVVVLGEVIQLPFGLGTRDGFELEV